MRKEHSKNNKKLIYTSMFNFMYLGRIKVNIFPRGSDGFSVFLQGARVIWDDDDINKSLIFIKSPDYKEKYFCKDIYQAINIFNIIVSYVVETFKDVDYINDLDLLPLNFDNLLPEIKEFL